MARYLRDLNCPNCGRTVHRTHHCQAPPKALVPMPKDFRRKVHEFEHHDPDPLPIEGLDQ